MKKNRKHLKVYFILLLAFLANLTIQAQSINNDKIAPLFRSDDMLELKISADFKKLLLIKDDSTYFPAQLYLINDSIVSTPLSLEIRTRGKTRRERDVCKFTPLRLKFKKKTTKNTVFEGQKKIKLVTHCNKPGFAEQNTIIEYLIYKTFNILTDSSIRVRPAMITYDYLYDEKYSVRKFAFFIEHDKLLAKRLNGIELEVKKIPPTHLSVFHTCLMDMFQYMIGNTDYSAYELHNIKLVSDSGRIMPPLAIPYDFDWSGLISAFYAVPNPKLSIEKVSDRVYRGFKKRPEIVAHSIEIFKKKKDDIYALYTNCELLNKSEKREIVNYLDSFYYIINDERLIKREFIKKARIIHD